MYSGLYLPMLFFSQLLGSSNKQRAVDFLNFQALGWIGSQTSMTLKAEPNKTLINPNLERSRTIRFHHFHPTYKSYCYDINMPYKASRFFNTSYKETCITGRARYRFAFAPWTGWPSRRRHFCFQKRNATEERLDFQALLRVLSIQFNTLLLILLILLMMIINDDYDDYDDDY